jgi:two-component system chemotaxis response regulator CheY
MTAYPTREVLTRARELGATDILTKPFGTQHIALALGKLLPEEWTGAALGVGTR